jgi:hypothetical protein
VECVSKKLQCSPAPGIKAEDEKHWIDSDCPRCKEEEQKAEGADQGQEIMHEGLMNLWKGNETLKTVIAEIIALRETR